MKYTGLVEAKSRETLIKFIVGNIQVRLTVDGVEEMTHIDSHLHKLKKSALL